MYENDLSEDIIDPITNADDGAEDYFDPEESDFAPSEEVIEEVVAEDDIEQYGAEEQDDPWAWTKDLDPEKVKRTWTKFTPEWEAVKRERDELEQARQSFADEIRLGQMVTEDERLAQYLAAYDPYSQQEGEDAAELALRRVQELEARTMAERELADVHRWAADNGMPEFSDQDLIAHAMQAGIPSLMTAYRDKYFDAAAEARKNAALADIKRSRGAKSVPTSAGATRSAKTFTPKSIESMSEAEFEKHLPDILASYRKS